MVARFRFVNSVGMDLVLFIVTWFDVVACLVGFMLLISWVCCFVCWFIVCSCGLTCICVRCCFGVSEFGWV